MKQKNKNKNKPKTISQMCQSRGAMPPPSQADVIKKKKNNRKDVKQKLKQGNYDV